MSPPRSRWQQLYSSSNTASDNCWISNHDHLDDEDKSMTEWLKHVQSNEVDTLMDEKDVHSLVPPDDLEDKEADRILEYMESVMCEHHDEDLIESVIESQQHREAILQYRIENKTKLVMRQWNHYTQSQISNRQFVIMTITDMCNHHLKSNIFMNWKELYVQSCSMVHQCILKFYLRAWVDQIQYLATSLQRFRRKNLKRNLIRQWYKISINKEHGKRAAMHCARHLQLKWLRVWCRIVLQSKELLREQAAVTQQEIQERELEHGTKVNELRIVLSSSNCRKKEYCFDDQKIVSDHRSDCTRKRNNTRERKKKTNVRMRKVLRENYIHERNHKDKKVQNDKYSKDEEERKTYLNMKQEEKRLKEKKQAALEVAKKAWHLSKLHYSLGLLRRYFIDKWLVNIKQIQLQEIKATKFFAERTMNKCLASLSSYIKENKELVERRLYRNADNYFRLRLCESVLNKWHRLASKSHLVLYDKVLQLRLGFSRSRALYVWKLTSSAKRLQTIQLNTRAMKLRKNNISSWVVRRWRSGVKESKRESLENELVACKWREVRDWLDER